MICQTAGQSGARIIQKGDIGVAGENQSHAAVLSGGYVLKGSEKHGVRFEAH